MSVRYNDDFKREVVRAYMAGNKSTVELAAEYNVAKSTILEWAKKYGEECQYKNTTQKTDESDSASEIRRLNQMLKEKDKEIEFLKKAAAFFAKEID
jgi:transposase